MKEKKEGMGKIMKKGSKEEKKKEGRNERKKEPTKELAIEWRSEQMNKQKLMKV